MALCGVIHWEAQKDVCVRPTIIQLHIYVGRTLTSTQQSFSKDNYIYNVQGIALQRIEPAHDPCPPGLLK